MRLYRDTNSRFHVVSDFRRVKLPASRKSLSGDRPRYARTKARCQVLSSFTCSYSSLLVIPSARRDAGSRYEVIWVSDSDGKDRRRELPLPCWVRRDCAFIVWFVVSFVDILEGLLRIKIERRKMESFVQTIGLSAAGGRRSEQEQSHANRDPDGHDVTLVCHFFEFPQLHQQDSPPLGCLETSGMSGGLEQLLSSCASPAEASRQLHQSCHFTSRTKQ